MTFLGHSVVAIKLCTGTCYSAASSTALAEGSTANRLQVGRPCIRMSVTEEHQVLTANSRISSTSSISHVFLSDCPSPASFHLRWPGRTSPVSWVVQFASRYLVVLSTSLTSSSCTSRNYKAPTQWVTCHFRYFIFVYFSFHLLPVLWAQAIASINNTITLRNNLQFQRVVL